MALISGSALQRVEPGKTLIIFMAMGRALVENLGLRAIPNVA